MDSKLIVSINVKMYYVDKSWVFSTSILIELLTLFFQKLLSKLICIFEHEHSIFHLYIKQIFQMHLHNYLVFTNNRILSSANAFFNYTNQWGISSLHMRESSFIYKINSYKEIGFEWYRYFFFKGCLSYHWLCNKK